MTKYAKTNFGTILEVGEHGIWPNIEKPVVVLSEEDWKRLDEAHKTLLCECHQERTPCDWCIMDEIIERVNKENQ